MWPGSRLGSRELGIMFGLLCSHRDTNFLSRDWSATALGCALIVAIARGSSSGAHKFKVSWLMVSRLWENERLAELNASLAQCEGYRPGVCGLGAMCLCQFFTATDVSVDNSSLRMRV